MNECRKCFYSVGYITFNRKDNQMTSNIRCFNTMFSTDLLIYVCFQKEMLEYSARNITAMRNTSAYRNVSSRYNIKTRIVM